jgi:flagellar M-ring protein FliF
LDTNGAILASGGDAVDAAPQKKVELEKSVGQELQENVRKTLAPYLGINNFELSVAARLNTDRRQTAETSYDPNSRVERSVRNVKETSNSENANGQSNVSAEQNVPVEQTASSGSDRSKRNSDRREELTNFELSSKTVNTVSNGYRIENLTIAVVVNKKQLLASLGKDAPPDALDKQLKEVERVVSTAAGVDTARGDRITVAAVDFIPEMERLEPLPSLSFVDELLRHSGAFVNALAIIVVTALLLWFGVRPALQALSAPPPGEAAETLLLEGGVSHQLAEGEQPMTAEEAQLAELMEKHATPLQRLENAIETNEVVAAVLMKQWLRS